jgi:hypothetical protein
MSGRRCWRWRAGPAEARLKSLMSRSAWPFFVTLSGAGAGRNAAIAARPRVRASSRGGECSRMFVVTKRRSNVGLEELRSWSGKRAARDSVATASGSLRHKRGAVGKWFLDGAISALGGKLTLLRAFRSAFLAAGESNDSSGMVPLCRDHAGTATWPADSSTMRTHAIRISTRSRPDGARLAHTPMDSRDSMSPVRGNRTQAPIASAA